MKSDIPVTNCFVCRNEMEQLNKQISENAGKLAASTKSTKYVLICIVLGEMCVKICIVIGEIYVVLGEIYVVIGEIYIVLSEICIIHDEICMYVVPYKSYFSREVIFAIYQLSWSEKLFSLKKFLRIASRS